MNTDLQREGTLETISWVLGQHARDGLSGKPRIALVDIDGVVLDNSHRLPHICEPHEGEMKDKPDADWDTFHSLAYLDTPGAYCEFLRALRFGGVHLIFVTARVAFAPHIRGETIEHLSRAIELSVHENELIMRRPRLPTDPKEGKTKYKVRVAETLARTLSIVMALDDSHENCMAFRELGIPTMRAYNHLHPNGLKY